MSKHILKREIDGEKYEVLAESLPSGDACFIFSPPLKGRSSTIIVEKDLVEDIVTFCSTQSSYDKESDSVVLSLDFVDGIVPIPDAPDCNAAISEVPAEVFLDMVLDEVMTPCEDCGDLHFGMDVLTPDDDGDVKRKTYLN